MPDLQSKTARKRLKVRTSPYFSNIGSGRALGYRKQSSGHAGKWIFRRTNELTGAYEKETIGTADDLTPADGNGILSYTQALSVITKKSNANPSEILVQEALDDWAAWKSKTASSDKQRTDYANAAKRIGKAFGKLNLATLKANHISKWRDDFLVGYEDTRPRMATANRSLAVLKAALNMAANQNAYEGKRVWDTVSKFSSEASFGARMIILTDRQESEVIAAARTDLAELLTAMQMTGARYGELRQIQCDDLNGSNLVIRKGKTGHRVISLSDIKAEWFAAKAEGKAPTEPLLCRTDGTQWPDGGHLKLFRDAIRDLNLPDGTTAYSFRHKFISDALSRGVPVAAVAQHAGTSVEMIMKSYAKFVPAQMKEWFA